MIIEDQSIITHSEKQFINTVILGGTIPFYWSKSQDHRDNKPFLYHTLIHRETQQIHSEHANFFKEIVKRFTTKHKLSCNVFLRGGINLTFPREGKGHTHWDHTFPHQQVIIYLNQSEGGSTTILSEKNKILKTIEPKQFKVISFNGKYPHYQTYPKKGRRMIAVVTFI